MEFEMLSQPLYTRTDHRKPSGELKSNVAYNSCEQSKLTTSTPLVVASGGYSPHSLHDTYNKSSRPII